MFFQKKRAGFEEKEVTIYMRLTLNGKYLDLSSRRKCDAKKWNPRAGRSAGLTAMDKSLNSYLDALTRKVYDIKKTLIEEGQAVTLENMRSLLMDRPIRKDDHQVLEVFARHNEQMAALVGAEYAPGTLERYTTSLKHTRSFIQWKYKKDDLDISALDHEFISDYEFWLKSVRRCDHNTTMKYLANFKKIVLKCVKNGWLARDPFLGFKLTKRPVDRTALTMHELEAIASLKLSIDRLAAVRDIFLFSCYTGLAYADVKKLRKSEVVTGIDGEKWISIKRQKTDSLSRIPLLPMAQEIIARYENSPGTAESTYVLPVLTNQKMNAYVKEIADLAGITKNLTYHIARHTFATTITLSNGVPIETVSKMLGHRDIKTTQHYAKILDQKISEDMLALKERLKTPVTNG